MKTYAEQNYPVELRLVVKSSAIIQPAGSKRYIVGAIRWFDAIKGLNTGHALWLAKANWPGASFTVL